MQPSRLRLPSPGYSAVLQPRLWAASASGTPATGLSAFPLGLASPYKGIIFKSRATHRTRVPASAAPFSIKNHISPPPFQRCSKNKADDKCYKIQCLRQVHSLIQPFVIRYISQATLHYFLTFSFRSFHQPQHPAAKAPPLLHSSNPAFWHSGLW